MSTATLSRATSLSVEDRLQIFDLYAEYAVALDNRDYRAWASFFTQEAEYRILPKENFDRDLPIAIIYCDGKGMIDDRAFAFLETVITQPRTLRHLVSAILVSGDDRARLEVRASFLVLQTMLDHTTEIVATGHYLDVVTLAGERPLFFAKKAITDTLLFPTSVVAPF